MRRRPRLSPARVIVALLAVTALGYAGMSFVDSGPGPGIDKPEIRSLAVLPLHNRSEDQNQEHISDGLTEALIDELAQINALERLPSLTTAMAYKGADKTLPEIARELSVDALIEGSWLRSGDEVEIRLRLIHGNSEEQLWSAEFAGNVSNVPTFLRRVSQAAADSIHVALSPAERERLAQRAYSPDPEAYDAYMMGRYHFWRFKDVDAPKANQYFEEAIALDPMYALAHAALAENCIFLTVLDPLSSTLEVEKCERLARRALELDEDLPDAHSALALVKTLKWDWEGAEESFRRAIDLKPNSVTAHLWYGWFLSIVMRLDESLVEARRAEELDRRNLLVKTMVAQPLMNAHRYDEALAQMDAVLEMDPDYGAAHLYKSHAYALSGRPNEALESARRAANDLGEDYLGVHVLEGWYHALVGETDLALATIDRIQELFGEDSAPSVAMIYLALGREEDALQGLEVGYRAHSPWLPNQTSWANLDGLRDHPRFVEMRRGMGLE
jgi:TolB-like protein/Tfp pilus assembly protein PilF